MERYQAARAALRPLGLLLLVLLYGCAAIPYDYPRPVSSALYRPEGTSMGQKIQAQAVNHPGASGFFLLPTGIDAFAARVRLIDKAEKTLDLQYYIFHDDLTGKFVYDRLMAAADRGVRVRLLLDDWHQTPETDWLLAAMAIHPNIEVRLFNPFGTHRRTFLARALRMAFGPNRLRGRMHNKAFIADNSVAIVGGRNIGAEYFGAGDEFNFYDVDIMAVGPITRRGERDFRRTLELHPVDAISGLVSHRPTADDHKSARRDLETQRESLKKSTYWLKVQESDLLKQIDAGKVPLVWGQAEVLSDHPLKCIDPDDSRQAVKMTQKLKGIIGEDPRASSSWSPPTSCPARPGVRSFRKMSGPQPEDQNNYQLLPLHRRTPLAQSAICATARTS